jgi:hypothetical protein
VADNNRRSCAFLSGASSSVTLYLKSLVLIERIRVACQILEDSVVLEALVDGIRSCHGDSYQRNFFCSPGTVGSQVRIQVISTGANNSITRKIVKVCELEILGRVVNASASRPIHGMTSGQMPFIMVPPNFISLGI